ncbi:MAG TPA: ERF family protein [Terriglobales bacterium]|jgi:hypothetical protein
MATARPLNAQLEAFPNRKKPPQSERWWKKFIPASQAIEVLPTAIQNIEAATPNELLRIAVSQKANVEELNRLMDLQERWEKNEAKKAYVVAMNAFKANPPEITKNELAKFTSVKNGKEIEIEWWYSTLDHIHGIILAEMSKHGISHRWVTEQPNTETIRVTCILTHKLGHSEQTTLQGPIDHSGSKNAIQAIGSSAKYLERYTLMAATGLADGTPDVDGSASAANQPSASVNDTMKKIRAARNAAELREIFTTAYTQAENAKDNQAKATLIAAKDARLRELR